MPNVAEVIGSYDGNYVMYWSDIDTPDWPTNGLDYKAMGGTGHDTWTHVAIYRSTAGQDAEILAGWPNQFCGGKSCPSDQFCAGPRCCPERPDRCIPGCPC